MSQAGSTSPIYEVRMAAKRSYIVMRTTTRLNYRTACSSNAGTIAGVFDEGTAIPVLGNYSVMACGVRWRKVKVGRKCYYVVADYLQSL